MLNIYNSDKNRAHRQCYITVTVLYTVKIGKTIVDKFGALSFSINIAGREASFTAKIIVSLTCIWQKFVEAMGTVLELTEEIFACIMSPGIKRLQVTVIQGLIIRLIRV